MAAPSPTTSRTRGRTSRTPPRRSSRPTRTRRRSTRAHANLWLINSNGPYKLEGGTFDNNTGGVFVRNDQYDPSTDSTDVREALPDEFDFEFVADTDTIFNRLIADSGTDQTAFTDINIPDELLLPDHR